MLPEEVLKEQQCLHSAQPCPSLVLLKLLTHLLLPVEVLSWSTIRLVFLQSCTSMLCNCCLYESEQAYRIQAVRLSSPKILPSAYQLRISALSLSKGSAV